jgi:hypothetical protein
MARIGIVTAFLYLGIGASWTFASGPPQGELARFPTFGVAFREPKGWAEQMRDKAKTVARWISPDSTPDAPVATIIVECGHTPARSLDEVARGLARNFHGVVDDHPTTLGGTRALRIIAGSDGRTLRPVEGLATIHDGLLYLVMGGVTAGHSVEEVVEAIRASWTWMPIEPTDKHLDFRARPLPLSGGAATLNVPELMYTYPTEHPDRVLDLGLHNVIRNEPDLLAYVQTLTLAEGQSFDEYKARLSENLRAQGVVKGAIRWTRRGNDPSRVVSPAVDVELPNKDGGRTRSLLRWALVKLDDRRFVSVNFTLPRETPWNQSTFITLTDRIADSIRPGAGLRPVEVREERPIGK